MTNYKHTDAAIEAAKEYAEVVREMVKSETILPEVYNAFLLGVEWSEQWENIRENNPPKGQIQLFDKENGIRTWYNPGLSPEHFEKVEATHWKHLPNPPQE